MVPDLRKGCFGNIAAINLEKSAGLNNTSVRNKTEAGTSQASSGDGIHPVCFEGNRLSLLSCSLPEDAVVMGSACGFEL